MIPSTDDALFLGVLRMTVGEWGWGVSTEGGGLYLIHVGELPMFLLAVDVGESSVDVHLDRGPRRDVREDTFPLSGWRAKVSGWATSKLRDLGVEPVEIGGGS